MIRTIVVAAVVALGWFAPRAEAQGVGRFTCSSIDYQRRLCPARTDLGVRLVRQLSESPCVRGRTWWRDERGVVVTEGCSAEFEAGYREAPYVTPPSYGGGGYVRPDRLVCKSTDYRRRYCPADVGWGAVALVRQRSAARCIYGRTWSYDRRGVWVSDGCEGEFEIGYQESAWRPPVGGGRWLRCESRDYTRAVCDTGGGYARLARQVSRAPCIEGQSWGTTRRGVWVDQGCAADFEVR